MEMKAGESNPPWNFNPWTTQHGDSHRLIFKAGGSDNEWSLKKNISVLDSSKDYENNQ